MIPGFAWVVEVVILRKQYLQQQNTMNRWDCLCKFRTTSKESWVFPGPFDTNSQVNLFNVKQFTLSGACERSQFVQTPLEHDLLK